MRSFCAHAPGLAQNSARLNVIDLLSILPINGLHGSKWGTSSRGFFFTSAAAAAHFIPISKTHWWSFLSGRCVRQSLKRLSAENCSPLSSSPPEPDRTIVALKYAKHMFETIIGISFPPRGVCYLFLFRLFFSFEKSGAFCSICECFSIDQVKKKESTFPSPQLWFELRPEEKWVINDAFICCYLLLFFSENTEKHSDGLIFFLAIVNGKE